MTSIVAWAGVDPRGVASVYIASDSRISWGKQHWDQGRKVFACSTQPHIFGYWGDVLFPALALPSIADRIDRLGPPLTGGINVDIEQAVRKLWEDYPRQQRRDVGIIHVSRAGDGMAAKFAVSVLTYESASDTWATTGVGLPNHSAVLRLAGSGSAAVRSAHDAWQGSAARRTSRAVFSAFCEALESGTDSYSGGAPQLVGLYRIGAGRMYGIVHGDQRYLAGARLPGYEIPEGVEWRNELFERVDGRRKKILPGAQRHEPRSGEG